MDKRNSSFARQPWSISALCRSIADIFDADFNPVQVVGEVTGFVQAASGHCYFSLKDAQAQIRCAMFRRTAVGLSALPADGDVVEVTARISVHAPRGDLQLVVDRVQPVGQGAALEQFLRLKSMLQQEGLFSADRKREVEAFPACIGVVTSLDAAALSDVLTALGRRAPHVRVVLSPCSVQGAESPTSIVDALESLYALLRGGASGAAWTPDTILLVRGGGAWEDLRAFNDESVARCIARSPVPVISGVGHETDFTIADFVADVRAATPTAAAELCALAQEETQVRLDALAKRAVKAFDARLNDGSQRLDWIAAVFARPDEGVRNMAIRLEQLAQQLLASARARQIAADTVLNANSDALRASCRRAMDAFFRTLEAKDSRLSAANPAQALARGFAWLEGPNGLVTSIKQIDVGDTLRATLSDGVVELSVTDTQC